MVGGVGNQQEPHGGRLGGRDFLVRYLTLWEYQSSLVKAVGFSFHCGCTVAIHLGTALGVQFCTMLGRLQSWSYRSISYWAWSPLSKKPDSSLHEYVRCGCH